MQKLIDSHIHFWDTAKLRYPWLDGNDVLNVPHLPADLPESGDGWTMEKLVFVQAACLPEQGIDEARWVAELAQKDNRIRGIVAFAALEKGEAVRAQLEALRMIPLVKGVRRLIQSEADGFSRRLDFMRGVQSLDDYGFTFDICILHHQLPDVIELVRQSSRVRFVLDHAGKPDIKNGVMEPWRENLKQLAAFDNVMCKISGLVTEANPDQWTAEDLQPYIEYALEVFGPKRVMFGGDYPVFKVAHTTYPQWVKVVMDATASLSEDEKRALFYDNADRFYHLQ